MAVWCAINSFNAGELSPKLEGRTDVSQYSKGCRKLENFIVTPYGAVERRPGTEFLGYTLKHQSDVRLGRFVFSSEIAYLMEFGEKYLRFFRNNEIVKDASGADLVIATPYTAAELPQIQYIQSADVMTIVHPNHPVMELKRLAVNRFSFIEKTYKYPPMLDPNLDDDFTLKAAGTLTVGGTVTLTATKDCFASGNVGGYFQLVQTRKSNEISIDFDKDGVSEPLEVFGYWTFTTHGTWTGVITIQRSYDKGTTWNDYRTYSSEKDSNTSTSGEEETEEVLYRLKMTDYEASSTGTLKLCRCLLVNPDFIVTGVVKITAVTSATQATGTVVRKLADSNPTTEWNEGAWSVRRGYPCSIAFFEERMFFGGTAYRPQTVWGSHTNAWDDYLLGDKDADGLEFTLASDTVNTIRWITQHDALVIGTLDSEWTLSASSSDAALTASNFRVKRQSVYGSAEVSAVMAGEVLLFVQRSERKVREFVFSFEKDGYSAPDMTILAEHITQSGIRQITLQQLPDTILWCVLNNGTAAAFTYEREQDVVGWQRIVTDGKIISAMCIPNGPRDELYLVVKRGDKQYIEHVRERADLNYLDCSKSFTGKSMLEISGLEYLSGFTVGILADGAPQAPRKVVDGKVKLDIPADKVVVGLPYTSILSPMPIEIDTQEGSSMLRRKSIREVRIRVYDSIGGEIRAGSENWQQIFSRDMLDDSMDMAITPKTEVVRIPSLGGYEDASTVEIRQTEPLPMNITALTVNYEVVE
jgi:hypothetical protein